MKENFISELIEHIKTGSCVVFIGAGFTMPATPNWFELINSLADEVSGESQKRVQNFIEVISGSKNTTGILGYEMAAQLIRDKLADENEFNDVLKNKLIPKDKHLKKMQKRKSLLMQIPFAAVLTTNFDGIIKGNLPGPKAYEEVLRSAPRVWTSRHPGFTPDVNTIIRETPTIQLHGDVERSDSEGGTPVFTSQDYRHRLFSEGAYLTFLRSVMATRTVLFLGFSFSDPYINMVREEVLAQFQETSSGKNYVYAVLPDISDDMVDHMTNQEGLSVISYKSDNYHEEFDDILSELSSKTNPVSLAPELVKGKRILWLDPVPERNRTAAEVLGKDTLITLDSIEEARKYLRENGDATDLVISHWGHNQATDEKGNLAPAGSLLLKYVREENICAPVVIFASGDHYHENRKLALGLGAFEYTCTFQGLLAQIDTLFSETILM